MARRGRHWLLRTMRLMRAKPQITWFELKRGAPKYLLHLAELEEAFIGAEVRWVERRGVRKGLAISRGYAAMTSFLLGRSKCLLPSPSEARSQPRKQREFSAGWPNGERVQSGGWLAKPIWDPTFFANRVVWRKSSRRCRSRADGPAGRLHSSLRGRRCGRRKFGPERGRRINL